MKTLPLTENIDVHTVISRIARPPKEDHLRRSKLFPLWHTPSGIAQIEPASRRHQEPVADFVRDGAVLYLEMRSRDGSQPKEPK